MDPRARWQSLQAHLSAARFAVKMGDRDKAREEVRTALSIDPEFLAARLLRDELEAAPPGPAVVATDQVRLKPDTTYRLKPDATREAAAKLAQMEARIRQRVKDRARDPVRHIVVPPRPQVTARLYRRGAIAMAIATFLAAMVG